jgi:hypothetical protein
MTCGEEGPYIPLYNPVVLDRDDFESSVEALPPQDVTKAGKIYIKDNLMFVNDLNKGFHVYNYSDPSSPLIIGFIKTIGATDLAVRDNVIYINHAVDLLTLSYDPATNAISVLHRNRNVFPQKVSPHGDTFAGSTGDQIVIEWVPNQN